MTPGVRECRPRGRRFGAILLETLVAIALFAGAALFVIAALRESSAATARAANKARATDLARTVISELEAGLANETELVRRSVSDDDDLRVEIRTTPSAHEQLTLVEVAVRMTADDGEETVLVTLRQLVRAPRTTSGGAP